MLNRGEQAVYHVISQTALDGFPFGGIEKEELIKIIQNSASFTLSILFGFCIMGNHFHMLVNGLEKTLLLRYAAFLCRLC